MGDEMSGWKRIVLAVIGVLLIVGGSAYYWLIVESHMPADAHFELDINKVRELADQIPGDKPIEIQAEQVAKFSFPSTAVVAGDGWSMTDLPVFSYQLVYSDGRTGIVDTALSKEQGGDNLTGFDQAAYDRMEAAIGRASFILLTHEHMDHIGGLAAYPQLANIVPSVDMTKEQIDHPERSLPVVIAKDILGQFKPLAYDKYLAVAPGVVLIKSPGHSPGSQMVYVRKQDGTEILFLGDVAWHFRNIETLRERARLMTRFFLKEDRLAVFGELKALSELHTAEPDLAIMPGHDGLVEAALVDKGVFVEGFK